MMHGARGVDPATADEQSALRRVARLVAGGAAPPAVFDAVAREACGLLGGHFTALLRYEPDGTAVITAMHGSRAVGHVIHIGLRLSTDGDGVVPRVRRSARAARLDSYDGVPGGNATTAMSLGLIGGVGAPIITDGRVWGVITVLSAAQPLPPLAETRLGLFAELVATAIAHAQVRTELQGLADEQAALRRVAELVARTVSPHDVFGAVATEASSLLDGQPTTLTRFEGDYELLVEAAPDGPAPVGTRITFQPGTLPDRVRRGGRVARVDDYTLERDARLAAEFGLAAVVSAPITVGGQVWGMLTATSDTRPLPAGAEHRLEQFAQLVAAALANSQARAELHALADQQTALRHVAELAAREAPPDQVLAAVAEQASRLAGVEYTTLWRYEPDGSAEIVAVDGAPDGVVVGARELGTGDGATQRVWRTAQPARLDNLARASGRWPQIVPGSGYATSAAVPILIQDTLWGVLVVVGRRQPFPRTIEEHLRNFADLVGAAISAAQARRRLQVLADEQAALRRVAELVARGAALDEVFSAVATEASVLLGGLAAALLRYDPHPQDVAVVVAVRNSPAPLGLRVPLDVGTGIGDVFRTGEPARLDTFEGTPLAEVARTLGVVAGVAVPITLEGRIWGTLTTSSSGPPIPVGIEDRLTQFAELAAAAIANAENKAKLTASRARVVATADETRRRLQRDVHDGAQQRLVHAIIALKLARDAIAAGGTAAALVDEALRNAEHASRELRDVVRGILPASLTRGGLRSGVESLVADLPLPVDVRIIVPRLPADTETTAYFVVAEALTNVVKHARATRATVEVTLQAELLAIEVRDDGIGGADPDRGTGLTGLLDRVDAAEGSFTVTSPAGQGTTLHAALPLHRSAPT
ncbi:MAG: GAF domain-containing protein [Nakamurella sp.]